MLVGRLGLLVLIVVAATVHAAAAQTARERFQLFNDCGPMELLVEGLGADELAIGLTVERLQFAAESRLRGARLFRSSHNPLGTLLYVNVNVNGTAFSISLEFNKWVHDEISGEGGVAVTWSTGGTGRSRDPEFVVSGVSRYLDQFLTEYLRVNEEACER